MTDTGQASPRTVLLSRIADARVRDPAAAEPRVMQALREELAIPLRGLVGLSRAIADEAPATGSERLVAGARRVHDAGQLVLPVLDEALDPARIPAGKHADEWEAVCARLRGYLRPPIAAVMAYAEMFAEDPALAGHERHVAHLEQAAQAGGYALGLIDDVTHLLASLSDDGPAPGAGPEVRAVVERYRPQQRAGRPKPGSQGSILVIDDSQVNRDLLDRMLSRLGYRVALSESGLQGLARMRAGGFDLVLLDIIMPEVDGFQVLHQMKLDAALRDVPVVMISALDEVESVGRCIEMGAEDYLTKPFDPVILKTRLGAAIEKQRLRKRVSAEAR